MSTVYTLNGKVLKNAANDKWLAKKEAPAGFVMDASNVVSSSDGYAYWASPSNPNAYDGDGKTIQLTVSETIGSGRTGVSYPILYTSSTQGGGPEAALFDTTDGFIQPGTYTVQMASNPAYSQGYGAYLSIFAQDAELLADILPKITITILDP